MVIQTDLCPGVGYPQQQGYAMHQQSQYPTNVYYRPVSGTQMVPIPYTSGPQYPNHHGMFYGGHNQNEDWKETNKQQDGGCTGSGHRGVGYDSNDLKQENRKEMNKQQDGRHSGSGHHDQGYDFNDTSKFSQVGKGGQGGYHDQEVPSNGYGVYQDQAVPSNRYGAHTYGAHATWGSGQPYPSQGYQTVEYWAVKGV